MIFTRPFRRSGFFVPAKAARGLQQFRKQFPPPIRERRFSAYNKCTEKIPMFQVPVLRILGAEKVKTSTKVPESMKKESSSNATLFVFYLSTYSASNASLPSPHTGHTQSAGTSSHFVPGATPLSGSPFAGSYSYPQTISCALPLTILKNDGIMYLYFML